MYYLADRPERAFVSEELMLIPEDTELPPNYVYGPQPEDQDPGLVKAHSTIHPIELNIYLSIWIDI